MSSRMYTWGHVQKFPYWIEIYTYLCHWLVSLSLLCAVLALLSLDVGRTGFSTERIAVWFVGWESKCRVHLAL